MYDTVHLWLDTSGEDPSHTENKLCCLNDQREIIDRQTGAIVQCGRLKNLRVKSGERGVLVQGSLAKFHLGTNANVLSRKGTKEAIGELGDILSMPIDKARVSRLDVAQNFIMKRPVQDYLSRFIQVSRMQKSGFHDNQTVSFSNGQKSIMAYNKARQLFKSHEPVPELFQGRNVLRFELQLKRRLGKQFDRHAVIASDLHEELFYMTALDKWRQGYFLIQKVRKECALSMVNVKDYMKSLAFYGVQNIGGVEVALEILQSKKQRGELEKHQYYHLKKATEELAMYKPNEEEIISELDSKVVQAIANYR